MTNQTETDPKPAWDAKLDLHDLEDGSVPDDPLSLFGQWFNEARAAEIIEPTGATLATADGNGLPSARTVLVKRFDDQGFYFYTNYDSRKGNELAENPQAALLFWWDALERQVRITGPASKINAQASDDYFASRPRGSQIGAHASPQSAAIAHRDELVQRFAQTEAKFSESPVPRPENWGGYRLQPRQIEFWQGRRNRLHDRLCYTHSNNTWRLKRLAP